MKRFMRAPAARADTGFTLVEVVVVMLIFAVVIAMVAVMTRGISAAQRRSLTTTRIAGVEAALVQFVLTQKRLPCPADGTRPSTDNNAGIEGPRNAANGCTGTQQDGVVPWRAIALSENEITDGWERRLTYRVFPALAADNGMNMSMCDPVGTDTAFAPAQTCNTACVSTTAASCTPPAWFLSNKGIIVKNIAGATLMAPAAWPALDGTGAAYVVISHGESGGGGYLNTGTLMASTVGDGTAEQGNYASLPYVAGVTFYVDDSTNDTAGTTHFDDILARPSIMSVANKAGLGPRAH